MKTLFSGTFSWTRRLSGNYLKFINKYLEYISSSIFFTYLFSIHNELLISIFYLQYWFLENGQDIMFNIFSHFCKYTFKIQSLYTPENYSKTFKSKSYSRNSFWRKGYVWDSWKKSIWHKNLQQMAKTKKLLFSLLDDPTLNANLWKQFWFLRNLLLVSLPKKPQHDMVKRFDHFRWSLKRQSPGYNHKTNRFLSDVSVISLTKITHLMKNYWIQTVLFQYITGIYSSL